jgi:hypothetical protein
MLIASSFPFYKVRFWPLVAFEECDSDDILLPPILLSPPYTHHVIFADCMTPPWFLEIYPVEFIR